MTSRPLAAILLLLAVGCDSGGDEPNRAPVTAPDEATTNEDTPISIPVLANDSDPDGDTLQIRILEQPDPAVGRLRRDGASIVFEPAADSSGDVEVDYEVIDGYDAVDAHLTIHVTPVNDAPVAVAQALEAGRNEPIDVRLAGVDIDGDALTFEVVAQPAHGTLTGTSPDLVYTPTAGYAGADSFRFVARDAALASAEAAVAVQVFPGARPVATSQAHTLAEDTTVAVTLAGTDADGDALTFAVVTPPVHGTLSGTVPNLTYTPAANFNGADVFYFTAADGTLTSNAGRVDLSINAGPDAPTAGAMTLTTNEDQSLTNQHLAGSDPDGGSLTYAVVDQADHGQVTYVTGTGTFSYAPQANFNGSDSFAYTVSDGLSTSAAATVVIDVAAVADQPVAQSATHDTMEDQARPVALVATDVDGNPSTFTYTAPTVGTLTGTGSDLTYTPPPNYAGAATFTFTASDDAGSSTATITIQVQAVDDLPTAAGFHIAATEDTPVSFTYLGSDVDNTNLSYAIQTPPTAGTVNGSVYTPGPDRNGADSFVYRVTAGGQSATATVTIDIAPVSDPPRAVRDIVQVSGADTIDVLGNDEDPDGDAIELDGVGAASHGTATVDGDTVDYAPAAGFTGTDTFTYTITDAGGLASTATAYVGVGMFPGGVPLLALALVDTSTSEASENDISGDGRYVALVSEANLVAADTNNTYDVYVYDRLESALELISRRADGTAAGGRTPQISDDGRYVAFLSAGTGLVATDASTGNVGDVYVRDRTSGVTVIASVSTAGVQATSFGAGHVALSADGRHVAFTSRAHELVAGDANASTDVFVRDLDASVTERVSVTAAGLELDIGVVPWEPISVDADGSVVAFVSEASDIVDDDGTGEGVFVRDRTAGTTTRISQSTDGAPANVASSAPSLSADGSIVAFVSAANNLVPNDTNSRPDVFIRDRATGITYKSWWDSAGAKNVTISADGRYLAGHFTQPWPGTSLCMVIDRIASQVRNVMLLPDGTAPTSGFIHRCTISADGRYVSYVAGVQGLGEDPHPTDWYVYAAPVVW